MCAAHCDKCKELKEAKAVSATIYTPANSNEHELTMAAKMLASLSIVLLHA
jgi:hypothetical protein